MDTQYRKNLKAVAQACKDYTDDKIKKVYYDIGHNDITTDDHTNELAYQITAPANAKLLMLQSIGGNTVKLSPSVASDSTKAMIKAMPSTVYTFDGSKFYGASEVSENLVILTDTAQTTDRGVTYSISNGTINVVDSATSNLTITLSSLTYFNGTYTLKNFGSQALSNSVYFVFLLNGQWDTVVTVKSDSGTITLNGNYVYGVAIVSGTTVSGTIKPMLVSGSTAPTEFKVGFSGIHNLELTGLKVEGQNYFSLDSYNGNGSEYNADTCYFKYKGGNQYYNFPQTITLKAGTYTIQRSTADKQLYLYDSSNNVIFATNGTASQTKTFENDVVITKYASWNGTWEGYLQIVRGSKTLGTYKPYIAPTTKTIDLTSIEDSNHNKLFPNGKLMGNANVKDVLGVYNQESKWNEVDLGDLNYTYDGTYGVFYAEVSDKKIGLYNLVPSVYSLSNASVWTDLNNMEIIGKDNNSYIFIKNTSYTSPADFKTAMSGVKLQYERNTYLTSNTDLSATLRNIQGYPNGSIIAENTHNMEVESVITYNSIIQETLCPSITITRNGVEVETRNLPTITSDGWSAGTQRNYRVFCDDEGNEVSKRENNVSKESNLGAFTWSTVNTDVMQSFGLQDVIKRTNNSTNPNVLCRLYSADTANRVYNKTTDKTIAVNSSGAIQIFDTLYDNTTIFKTAMTNEQLYYELADASKSESDMDDFDYFFDVEEGDVITFNNPYAQQVYATYSFLIKEAKSNE